MVVYVKTSDGRIEKQSNKRIENTLIHEAGLPKNIARKVAENVHKQLEKLGFEYVSGPLIRELVNIKLLELGLKDARDKYTRVGMPVHDVTKLIYNMDKENANTYYNPEFVHKAMGDKVSREYALLNVIPEKASRAHMRGEIHIHDMDYFITRPFCFEVPARLFLKHGLKTDGMGVYTATAGPAKHLNSAVMQLAKVLQTSQTTFSGGQGYDFINYVLAPYVDDLSYEKIKQIIQYFIYELDMSNFSRGGQTAFTSISLEFSCPDFLKNTNALLPGGVEKEGLTYSQFEDEAKELMNAFIDVYMKGDYTGKCFSFPKPEFKLRRNVVKTKKYDNTLNKISELVSKYGAPYFLNLAAPYMPNAVQSQCCRYFLIPDSKQMKEVEKGEFRFGSLQTVTINLPNIGYQCEGDEDRMREIISERFEVAQLVFDAKRKFLRKYLLNGGAPFLTQEFDGKPYFNLESSTNSIGFVGLNELVKIMTGEELHESRDAWKFGLRIIDVLKKKTIEMQNKTEQRWSLVQTPAESTAQRFAKLDKKFNGRTVAKGKKGTNSVYYTNSSHVFVGADIPLWKRLKIESSFHPLLMGGAISHIWLGEKSPDPHAITKMIKKIANKTLCSYWAFTKDMSVCMDCNKVSGGLKNKCPSCRSKKIEWYSRVTGYLTRIKAWNKGKKAELKDRKRYDL